MGHGRASRLARDTFQEANALDEAIYRAIADTSTPTIDIVLSGISNATNYSLLWVVAALALASDGNGRGRRAAVRGLFAVGLSSIAANVLAKHLVGRHRPQRSRATGREQVSMPNSSSFPSGHTSSAFAFATAVTADLPESSLFLYGLASLVGYSRVHSGVHYPRDVQGY